ncbi:hypothetical protein VHEMI02468 [[Torrubiella] hemipterigena]|uniref:RNase H type-1 domain-containing protein n=1 Tax=[Torrubiella] hemipterigena TaxID=1531966 RepID=A0A0A1T7Y7_9HYPO|nr:hypothetical protein VHEMI02468 [[Torrubiella] hemipterigena]
MGLLFTWTVRSSKIIKTEIDRGSRQLGFREVFDAEISGALRGLRQAIKHCTPNTPITVCIDNSSVVRGIGGTALMLSRAEFLAFQAIRDEFPGRISVRWTPGHKDIPGNEAADTLAKKGAAGPLRDLTPSVAQRQREIRALLPHLFRTWWESVEKRTYQSLGLTADLSKLPELDIPRQLLRHLLAARSHHGDFAVYYQRFHHDNATLECPCGHEKTPTHLFGMFAADL